MTEYQHLMIRFLILEEEIKKLLEPLTEKVENLEKEMEERMRRQSERRLKSTARTASSHKELTEQEEEEKLVEIRRLCRECLTELSEIRNKYTEYENIQHTLQNYKAESHATKLKPPASKISHPPHTSLSIHDISNGMGGGASKSSTTAQYPDAFFQSEAEGKLPDEQEDPAQRLRMAHTLTYNRSNYRKARFSMIFGKASLLALIYGAFFKAFFFSYFLGPVGILLGTFLSYKYFFRKRKKTTEKYLDDKINAARILDDLGEHEAARELLEKDH